MTFNNYNEMVNYFSKEFKGLKLFLNGYYLKVKVNDRFICNYDLRFTNFLKLSIDLSKLNQRIKKDLNYKF